HVDLLEAPQEDGDVLHRRNDYRADDEHPAQQRHRLAPGPLQQPPSSHPQQSREMRGRTLYITAWTQQIVVRISEWTAKPTSFSRTRFFSPSLRSAYSC